MKRIVLLLMIFTGIPALILQVEASQLEEDGTLFVREVAPLSSEATFVPTAKPRSAPSIPRIVASQLKCLVTLPIWIRSLIRGAEKQTNTAVRTHCQ